MQAERPSRALVFRVTFAKAKSQVLMSTTAHERGASITSCSKGALDVQRIVHSTSILPRSIASRRWHQASHISPFMPSKLIRNIRVVHSSFRKR